MNDTNDVDAKNDIHSGTTNNRNTNSIIHRSLQQKNLTLHLLSVWWYVIIIRAARIKSNVYKVSTIRYSRRYPYGILHCLIYFKVCKNMDNTLKM